MREKPIKSTITFRLIAIFCFATILVGDFSPASAATIRVGPSGDVTSISAAAGLAKNGDTVEIQAGDWHGDVALWEGKDLVIRGVGGRPVLHADGKSMEGKAIWVFRQGKYIVDNIEFRDARVPDGNGAGIRLESGKLHVIRSHFSNNQNGILTSNDELVELEVESCLFSDAPKMFDPPPHLIYIGKIAFVKIAGSRFHNGYAGHLIKSRAKVTELTYNLIVDGPEGEASYEVDLPNGGAVQLIGNVIGQSSRSQNRTVISYGSEGVKWVNSSLLISYNTLLTDGVKPAWFIRVWKNRVPANFKVMLVNNIYSGIGLFNYGLNGDFRGNWLFPKSVFNDPEMLDFRLADNSIFKSIVRAAPVEAVAGYPVNEFKFPLGIQKIKPRTFVLPGAFQ